MRTPFSDKLSAASKMFAQADDSTRMAWFRCVLVVGMLAGILLSVPLWTAQRLFPLLPVGSWFPSIPAPWDKWFLGAWLLALVLSPCFPRGGVIAFLSGAVFLGLSDQNRLQPWVYLYSVMLLLTLSNKKTALAGARIALSGVYLWSGVMKLTPDFFHEIAPWFVDPFVGSLPQPLQHILLFGARLTPFIEILIGVGLWLPRCRGWAIGSVLFIHTGALICLGPLGRSYNLVVWPWNVVMPILACVLFLGKSDSLRMTCRMLRQSCAMSATVMSFCAMPALSWMGWWDSYQSFAMYSGQGTVAAIYISEAFRNRLPEELRPFIRPLKTPPCLHNLEGTYLLDHVAWGLSVLGAPSLPEARGYGSLVRYLMQHHPDRASDVCMLIKTTRGPIRYYEGERCRGIVLPEPTTAEQLVSNAVPR